MRKLLQFLYEYRALLTFLLLEVISFVFIVNSNRYHSAAFFNSSNQFTGEIYQSKDGVVNYWKLDEENDSLALENAKLKKAYLTLLQKTQEDTLSKKQKESLYLSILDSLEGDAKYFDVIPSKIIKNSVRLTHNFLTLNKGKKDGVRKNMGVVNNIGVVGRVQAVSEHFSTITSLLHTRLMISSKIGANGTLCTTKWNGESPLYAQVLYVPSHEKIEKGDPIVTSGFDGIFPSDTPIGTVEDFSEDINSGLYTIRIQLANDFHKIHYVEILKNMNQIEIDSIQQKSL